MEQSNPNSATFASEEHTEVLNTLPGSVAKTDARDSLGHTPLWYAAANGQTELVRTLLNAGADVNTRDNDGFSALSAASEKGQIDTVKLLIDSGSHIETRDNYGDTPLWFAAANGHADVARALVSAGADVNTQNNFGISALSIASQGGYIDVVNILIDKGSQTEIRNIDSGTALLCAAAEGQANVVRALVSAGADVNAQNNSGVSVLSAASRLGNIDVLKILIDSRAETETRDIIGHTALFRAAEQGHAEVVQVLVSAGADVNIQSNSGLSALSAASLCGYTDVVNILIDNGAQIETRHNSGCTPLFYAAEKGHAEVVRALVSAGADVNTQDNYGSSPLDIAGGEGHVEVVNMLIKKGAQIEIRDIVGGTPLSFAASAGQTETVRALVLAGADVNAQSNLGGSALMSASLGGHVDVVNMLIEEGAQIEIRDNNDCTPLWHAAAAGQTDTVRALLSAGADVNAQDSLGGCALIIASIHGHVDTVNILIESNAQVESRDKNGSSPLVHAAGRGQADVVRALVSAGADVNAQDNDGHTALGGACLGGQHEIITNTSLFFDIEYSHNYAARKGQIDALRAQFMQHAQYMSATAVTACHTALSHMDQSMLISMGNLEGYLDVVNTLIKNGAQIETGSNCGMTPLFFAAINEKADIVHALVSAGADVNRRINDVMSSALSIASLCGLTDAVRILTDNGAQIEIRDTIGYTPLCHAAETGQADVARALIDAGADVNAQNVLGISVLSTASSMGHTDIVKILIDNNAQIDAIKDKYGSTPLWKAAFKGHTDAVHALINAGADVNTQHDLGISVLGAASMSGHIDIVNILIDNGAQPETRLNYGYTSLWRAACEGHADVVRALISAGADVNTQNNRGVSALSAASQGGFTDVATILIDNGANIETIDNDGETALFAAASKGHVELIDLLIGRGAAVDGFTYNRGSSPLSVAARSGHKHAVMTLLRHGANLRYFQGECEDPLSCVVKWCRNDEDQILQLLINSATVGKHGVNKSALMAAAFRGRFDIVRTLLEQGANVYERNWQDVASYSGHMDKVRTLSIVSSSVAALRHSNGHPPSAVNVDYHCNVAMHLTTDLQTMKSLLENGADVEAENVDGQRPIHCVIVRTGLVELVQLLIQHGANVNAADFIGNRPLHEAVCHGLNVVQLLVQHGAKLNVQNIDGKTPLHIAVEHQQGDVVVFLLSQDTDVGLTDVWHNTPLHYATSEFLAVSRVAGSVQKVLMEKRRYCSIRNIVDVSVSQHIRTYESSDNKCHEVQDSASNTVIKPSMLSNAHTTQAHNANFVCSDQLTADCNGNTPLHQAVGVYGQFKMYKVSADVTKTVEFLVKRGADINAQNNDGLTPLHVARGEKAIEACLRHVNDKSFTIADKRGRNFWHLLFLTRTQNEVELGTTIRPLISTSDAAKYNVDDLYRTPLHYACMDRNPWICECDWLAKEFTENFSDEHINRKDKFGRTALHYAEMGNNKELRNMLRTRKKTFNLEDDYQQISLDYTFIKLSSDIQVSRIRLTESSSFIAKHRRDISACVQGCFVESSSEVKECKAKMYEVGHRLTGSREKASYVLNTLHGCRYDYRDVMCKKHDARFRFEEDDDQQVCKEDLAMNDDDTGTKQTDMFVAIQKHIKSAMEELAKAITLLDHRFACKVFSVGSSYEGTRIGCCDEFDYDFVLTKLSSICKVCYSPESPPGFVRLEASTQVLDEDMDNLFDNSGILNTRAIKFKFEFLAKQVLSSASFCDLTGFEFIDPVSTDDLGLKRGNVTAKVNTDVKLLFTKPVNKHHVPHAISVDLVPALHIDDWLPDDAHRKELCREGDCLIVFTQPQNKYPWIGWTEPHGFISFARAESRLLRECRPVVKGAYKVVKRMSEYFCQYKFFSSHVIKTALFWCLGKEDLTKYIRSSDCSDEVQEDELLSLVRNILRRLLCFAAQDYVPDFFMPTCHQPVWLSEKYLKQYHMRLYQHGLTYKDLFSFSEEQSHDEVLLSIKNMFTFSHVMYWSLLSQGDDLKLFVPTAINPLCDNSYNDADE